MSPIVLQITHAIFLCCPEEVFLPKCLLCGGFTDYLSTAVMWFSSGGTKSVLHNDQFENINCLYDGSKELYMVDKVKKIYQIVTISTLILASNCASRNLRI